MSRADGRPPAGYPRSPMGNEALVYFAVVAVALGAGIGMMIMRRGKAVETKITIELGNNLDELRLNKKKYQLRLKELRIQSTELTAKGQTVRAIHRSKRWRSPGKGAWGRNHNIVAAREADAGLANVAMARHRLSAEIVQIERIINRIDECILQEECEAKEAKERKKAKGSSSRKRKPKDSGE